MLALGQMKVVSVFRALHDFNKFYWRYKTLSFRFYVYMVRIT